jgi:hypothetical protein
MERPTKELYRQLKAVLYEKFKEIRPEKWDIPIFRWIDNKGMFIFCINKFKMDILESEMSILSLHEGIPIFIIGDTEEYKKLNEEKIIHKEHKINKYIKIMEDNK